MPEIRGRRTPLDYLFFLRPVLLPPVWTIALLGTLPRPEESQIPVLSWIAFFLQLACLAGGVYTLNQICDVETDQLNRKLHFLPQELITVKSAWVFTVILDLSAVAIAACFGWVYVGLTMIGVTLGILYSAGPRPGKNQPWSGLAYNVAGHGVVVYLLGVVFAGDWGAAALEALSYGLAVAGVFLATTVPDRAGDMASGKRTLAVAYGEKAATIMATVAVSAAIALAAVNADRYLAFAGIGVWPFFLRAIWRGGEAAGLAARAAVAALSLAAVVVCPVYALVLVAGYFGTRLFFRWRFGMTYPNLV